MSNKRGGGINNLGASKQSPPLFIRQLRIASTSVDSLNYKIKSDAYGQKITNMDKFTVKLQIRKF